jgi:hypothetical protein
MFKRVLLKVQLDKKHLTAWAATDDDSDGRIRGEQNEETRLNFHDTYY